MVPVWIFTSPAKEHGGFVSKPQTIHEMVASSETLGKLVDVLFDVDDGVYEFNPPLTCVPGVTTYSFGELIGYIHKDRVIFNEMVKRLELYRDENRHLFTKGTLFVLIVKFLCVFLFSTVFIDQFCKFKLGLDLACEWNACD